MPNWLYAYVWCTVYQLHCRIAICVLHKVENSLHEHDYRPLFKLVFSFWGRSRSSLELCLWTPLHGDSNTQTLYFATPFTEFVKTPLINTLTLAAWLDFNPFNKIPVQFSSFVQNIQKSWRHKPSRPSFEIRIYKLVIESIFIYTAHSTVCTLSLTVLTIKVHMQK